MARLQWLRDLQLEVEQELEVAYAGAYFDARLRGELTAAIDVGGHSRKRALAMTRAENERRGRSVRWSDGLDATSSAYRR